ncbi:contact-dependent growth inhibition system immunity protein [Streptomyces sp. NPDC058676]|uniref:contact-dependent growth inhibition system immunity protein n=1 Tax=unclassified Streptomyces TaxID=2593676 RepID=UPI00364D1AA2
MAQELRAVLRFDDSHPAFQEVSRIIPARALREADARSVLTACAEYLERGEWRGVRNAADVSLNSLNSIEIRGWFPGIIEFSEVFLEDEISGSVEEVVAEYVEGCHPHCLWYLPELVGEAHRALAAFPSEALMRDAFDREVPLASVVGMTWTEWFTYLAGALSRHMAEAHANPPG